MRSWSVSFVILLHSAETSEVVSPISAKDAVDRNAAIVRVDHFAVADVNPDVRDTSFICA